MARSEFKRKRHYYTKAQIESGLMTDGKEWMFIDGTEYIGQYHKYTTKETFSEINFVKGKSRKLIPYVNVSSLGVETLEGLDLAKNFHYDEIKTLDIEKTTKPNSDIEPIKDKDLKNGYLERFFGYKYDDTCIELNEEKFNQIGTDKGLSGVTYKKVKLKWKIIGPVYDVKNEKGDIVDYGVFDTNKRTVALISEDYPSIKFKLLDFLQFYQP